MKASSSELTNLPSTVIVTPVGLVKSCNSTCSLFSSSAERKKVKNSLYSYTSPEEFPSFNPCTFDVF